MEEINWHYHLCSLKSVESSSKRVILACNQEIPINSVCPGYARTDIASNHGQLREVEASVDLALLCDGGCRALSSMNGKRCVCNGQLLHCWI